MAPLHNREEHRRAEIRRLPPLAIKDSGKARLRSRNNKDFTSRYPAIVIWADRAKNWARCCQSTFFTSTSRRYASLTSAVTKYLSIALFMVGLIRQQQEPSERIRYA